MTFFVGIWFQGSLRYDKYVIQNDIMELLWAGMNTDLKERMIGKTASQTARKEQEITNRWKAL